MKTIMRFKTIFALFIISSIILLYGCSSAKKDGKEGNDNESQPENGLMQNSEYDNAPYNGDFDSIESYVEKQVQDSRENRSNYTVKRGDYNASTEGGTIEGYYSDNSLKYIEVHIYGEMGRVSYNIYYIDESLKYFVKTSVQYDSPIGVDGGSDVVEEKREKYLIINDKIYEFTSDMKMLSDSDEKDYAALFADFEKTLKKIPAASATKGDPVESNPQNVGRSLADLEKEGLKVFKEHSFNIESDSFGKARLITGGSENENGLFGLRLYLADENNRLTYEFPDFYGNQWPMLYEVSEVSFSDANNDGQKDIIVIAYYMTGVGENGAKEFPVAGVYFQNGKSFFNKPELDEKINDAGANSAIEDVISYLGDIDVGTGDDAGAANIVPVAFNGLLAGSFHEGKWLDSQKTIPKMKGNIRYSIYSDFNLIGNGTGSMPFTDEYGLDNISVSIDNTPISYISETVEIGRTGDILSVKPTVYSKEFYSFIVKDFLDQRIDGEYTEEIIQGISADLDNDGKQEHLISVCSFDLSDYLTLRGWFRENNNFSYLLLVNEEKGGFEISVLAEALRSKADKDSAYYGGIDEGDMMIYRSEYNVLGLIDINGDMDLELVFYENVHEGTFYYVYEYNNGGYKKVLSCGMAD